MQNKIPVSVLIVTKNEQSNIVACLQSVKNFDEVIVIDSGSNDQTKQMAQRWGASVFDFKWDGRYPKKRQWTLENVPIKNQWCFFLDADERMTSALAHQMNTVAQNPACPNNAYFIQGQPIWMGKALANGRWHKKLTFFKKGCLSFPDFGDLMVPYMGEIEGHYQPSVEGNIGELGQPILHDCAHNPQAWVQKHKRYANWHAWVLKHNNRALTEHEKGLRRLSKSVLYKAPLKEWLAFADSYLLKAGFLDGKEGLSYARSRAWYYRQINRFMAADETESPHKEAAE